MAVFTRHDRIAIASIAVFIILGWGIRYVIHRGEEPDELRVIRNAVKPPAVLESPDKPSISRININSAGKKELETLPMIGPVKATAIIEYRQKHGNFTGISDIMDVRGIGPATYERIKNNITVEAGDISTVQEKNNNREKPEKK